MFYGPRTVKRAFPPELLAQIEDLISTGEKDHRGEIRFVAESSLTFAAIFKGQTPRSRAIDVFSELRVWDTQENSGILVYVLLADRAIEIVADRGISALLPQSIWDDYCLLAQKEFAAGNFSVGAIGLISALNKLLVQHFPAQDKNSNPNELPNRPLAR